MNDLLKVEAKQIRWLIRRDVPAVLSMECQTDRPWTDDDWTGHLRQRAVCGMAVEDQFGRVVGAALYELNKGHLVLIRMLVDEVCRRQGIATEMLLRLKDKLFQGRRRELVCCVNERNEPMLLTLRAFGFDVHAYERTDLGPFCDDLMIEMRYVLDREFSEDDLCEGRD